MSYFNSSINSGDLIGFDLPKSVLLANTNPHTKRKLKLIAKRDKDAIDLLLKTKSTS